MAGVNMTEVRLVKVPLENDYIHTFYFPSPAAQTSYFTGLTSKSALELSYQRKDNIIRFPVGYDELVGYNYVMYKNAAYSDKWWYAFILDMQYVDDGRTDIQIETDVIQTWLFDYNVKASFVEREHAKDDRFGGLHTVPETVELGEYICKQHAKAGYTGFTYGNESALNIVVGVTEVENDGSWEGVQGNRYAGIYSGIKYFAFQNTAEGITALNSFIAKYQNGKTEAIQCMFLTPDKMTNATSRGNGTGVVSGNTFDHWYINGSEAEISTNISFTDTIDGYAPRNNKLLTYPYRYILASNNSGGYAVYRNEEFYTGSGDSKKPTTPKFEIEGVITPGCSVRMIPLNYKGASRNDEEGLNLGKLPVLNWSSDYFTNWMTQNGVNVGASVVGGVAGILGGIGLIGTGAGAIMGASSIVSGAAAIGSAIGEVTKASIVPNQSSGNINCGDIITVSGQNDFHFYEMTIKREYAEIIDGYFDMFGYKVNRVKVPEKAHRQRYWYTKTIDVNIDGNVPVKDLQKIKDCYNRGITFWRYRDDIGNYPTTQDDNQPTMEPDA